MKKIIISATFILASLNLNAQDSQENETVAGIKIGATIPGTVHAGALLEHSFNKNIAFEAEVLYNQKDVTMTNSHIQYSNSKGGIINTQDYKYKFHYLQVPLNLKVSFGEKIRPYIMGGLAVGYALANTSNEPGTPAFKVNVSNLDWSYLGSIGVNYKPIFIEVRYNASFNPAVYVDQRLTNGSYQWFNRNLMISVGFKF